MTTVAPAGRPNDTITPQQPERTEVVVIGGGQAGLATGYHLARQGLRFVILDAHPRVGDAWRNRWDSLRLFTPAKYNALPGMPFPLPRSEYPTKDQMADYLVDYASALGLPVRASTKAQRVDRSKAHHGNWVIETEQGSIQTDCVVIATGGYQLPYVPDFATEFDPRIRQIHSRDYRNPDQLLPGPVLVVGASNSGAEIAMEVARHRQTVLAGPDPGHVPINFDSRLGRVAESMLWFALNNIVTVNTPIGRKAKSQVRHHGLPVERISRSDLRNAGVERVTERTVGSRDGKPVLEGGRVLDVANIVWCTGFHGDYSWIDGITYGTNGYPEQDRGVATKASGIYFVGLRFQRAGASSLVGGVGRDARHVVEHIAATVRQAQ